jgi:gamma-glutamyltranspeptidase
VTICNYHNQNSGLTENCLCCVMLISVGAPPDWGMDMQEAIEAPRVSLPYETQGIDHPSALSINVEGRIAASICDSLTTSGHRVNRKAAWDPFFGGMQGIEVHPRRQVRRPLRRFWRRFD